MIQTKIIGMGGAGNNITRFIQEQNPELGEFIFLNDEKTDEELQDILKPINVGKKRPNELMSDNYLILIAGLGGEYGTKTILRLSEMTVSSNARISIFVTLPFPFEGDKRINVAKKAQDQLISRGHYEFHIPNAAVLAEKENMTFQEAFEILNQRIYKKVLEDWKFAHNEWLK